MQTIINSRTHIRVYTSTAAAAVGYADNENQRIAAYATMMARPDYVGPLCAALEWIRAKRQTDGGVYRRVELRLAKTGEKVYEDDLEDALSRIGDEKGWW